MIKETTFPATVIAEDGNQYETTAKLACGVINVGNMDFATKIEGISINDYNIEDIEHIGINIPCRIINLKIKGLPVYEANDWKWNTENDYSTSINLRVANI